MIIMNSTLKFKKNTIETKRLYYVRYLLQEMFDNQPHNYQVIKLCFSLGIKYKDFNKKIVIDNDKFEIIYETENKESAFEIPANIMNRYGIGDAIMYLECLYNTEIEETKDLNIIYNYTKPTDFIFGFKEFCKFVDIGAKKVIEIEDSIPKVEGANITFVETLFNDYIDIFSKDEFRDF
jgi:hypothetical protein